MSSFLGRTDLTLGIRNNNPGNLVFTGIAWQGKIIPKVPQRFEQFSAVKWGIRAMLRDVVNDISKGKNTVSKLIHQYAPPSENNTKSYINDVSKALGIQPNDKITSINNEFLFLMAKPSDKLKLQTDSNSHLRSIII